MHGAEKLRRRAGGIKVVFHPLFLAVGILSAFTGGMLLFVAAVLAALEHELAHALAARRYGFELSRIVLMPYGAVISGDIAGMGRGNELKVLIAGPLVNLATGLAFVALWWLYPEVYPFTELAASISFSLFFVNLLPAYPLDGGRILRLLLQPIGKKRAKIVCGILSILTALGILGYFIWSCFSAPNFSALAFSLLLLFGAFGGGSYGRIAFSPKRFLRGVEEKRVAVDGSVSVQDAIRFLREDRYLTLILFEDGEYLGEISEEEFLAAMQRGAYAEPLNSLLSI